MILPFLHFVRSMEKIAWGGPKCGREGLFPANPDLADILGDMYVDYKNIHFVFIFLRFFMFPHFRFPNFWMFRFPDFQNLVRAGLEPSGPENVDFLS